MSHYEKYKETGIKWIGEIPEHWEVKKLKYEALVQPSSVDKKTIEGETTVFLCNYLDVYNNDFINRSIEFMEATATTSEIRKFLIKKGDVLATKDSETPDDIANAAYVTEDFENVICAYHLTHIRPFKNLLGRFLHRLFQDNKFRGQFEVSANGITRYGLSIDVFANAFILLPTIDEQIVIADYLDTKIEKIDSLVSNKQQLIKFLKEEQVGITNKIITGNSKNWRKKRLKYLANMQSGFAFNSSDFTNEGIQLVKISNLYQNEFALNRQPTFLPEEYLEKYSDWIVSDGDILISMTGTLGKRDYGYAIQIPNSGKKYLLNQRVSRIRFNESEITKEFALKVLLSNKYLDQLFLLPTGTKQGNLSNEHVLSIIIEYPDALEEQEALLNEIKLIETRFNDTIQKIQNELKLILEYRTSLISEIVTGRKKVI